MQSDAACRGTRRARSFEAGRSAEFTVAQDYARRGHAVVDTRWRGEAGEIDLIVRDGEGFIFVEVKKSRSFENAAVRLGRRQMDRICRTAGEFCEGEPLGALTAMRFDVALVDGQGLVKVIENAFGES
ncbi:hypothetical protein OCH239_18000 [Roseivivax halodurans JCM 10272]|uniref:UPF0102 protein OCH239_18000 n=1 Tax=Roseivivax halodurans JCM 10272 TaxID=1449350 RepID=X7EH09_9RHOB|nr:YraN family protein [Roseivivax halodurans]ETX15175.1 hypothetical protein OCH239_18000 [Roseivivax halodurans JCM 10272]